MSSSSIISMDYFCGTPFQNCNFFNQNCIQDGAPKAVNAVSFLVGHPV